MYNLQLREVNEEGFIRYQRYYEESNHKTEQEQLYKQQQLQLQQLQQK